MSKAIELEMSKKKNKKKNLPLIVHWPYKFEFFVFFVFQKTCMNKSCE